MGDERWFPIMGKEISSGKWWIPWRMLDPHAAQAQTNHTQTLERLAERGGLAPAEALAILDDRPWRDRSGLSYSAATLELQKRMIAFVLGEQRRACVTLVRSSNFVDGPGGTIEGQIADAISAMGSTFP